MQCRFCLSTNNTEDDERCHRCGKRLSGDITFDGLSLAGATALAPRGRTAVLETGFDEGPVETVRKPRRAAAAAACVADRQTSLVFDDVSNVIPFEAYRPIINVPGKAESFSQLAPGPAAKRLNSAKEVIKKQAVRHVDDNQGSLEFLQPAPVTTPTLKTTVDASIYCDAPVAMPMHRSVAAFLDLAMIVTGCGLFLGVFQAIGGHVPIDRFDVVMFSMVVVLITMFYGLLFAIAGSETPGQRWTELRLINFDGFAPDGVNRFLRFAGCWLGVCAGGIGLVWALLDEENLAWHDHMSKTFLTVRDTGTTFFRQRVR